MKPSTLVNKSYNIIKKDLSDFCVKQDYRYDKNGIIRISKIILKIIISIICVIWYAQITEGVGLVIKEIIEASLNFFSTIIITKEKAYELEALGLQNIIFWMFFLSMTYCSILITIVLNNMSLYYKEYEKYGAITYMQWVIKRAKKQYSTASSREILADRRKLI